MIVTIERQPVRVVIHLQNGLRIPIACPSEEEAKALRSKLLIALNTERGFIKHKNSWDLN